jgi:transposase-like protein
VPKLRRPLSTILIEGSSFSRWHLKNRLFEEGVKERRCEMCGQDELWRGRRMALILDHINGVADDHRLENLRIVCPNCAATLDTHCGKLNRRVHEPRDCPKCGKTFQPKHRLQRYCCRACAHRYVRGLPAPERRKVARPPYTHLVREIAAIGYEATARRYGVSGTAIRKWMRWYEREQERESELARVPRID